MYDYKYSLHVNTKHYDRPKYGLGGENVIYLSILLAEFMLSCITIDFQDKQ